MGSVSSGPLERICEDRIKSVREMPVKDKTNGSRIRQGELLDHDTGLMPVTSGRKEGRKSMQCCSEKVSARMTRNRRAKIAH